MVLVAKRDLRSNAQLDPEKDLAEFEIPARMIELKSRSLVPELRASYKGQRLNRDVLAGTPVMLADLAGGTMPELRGESRAMSVQVKSGNALGGLLQPGQWVKLLGDQAVAGHQAVAAPRHNTADILRSRNAPDRDHAFSTSI